MGFLSFLEAFHETHLHHPVILGFPSNPFTGVLILKIDKGPFLSQDLARANYQAELAEILHGTLLGDTTWVNRGVF